MPVFDYLISRGTSSEQDDPFTGNDQAACPANLSTPYRAVAWAFVGSKIDEIPPVANIKKALCDHGPLATAVFVDAPFQYYTGGVFDEHTQQFNWINHGVTIIGWDDTKGAWLIKNSWGPGWGETGGYGTSKGYMWIAYNTNNVGIATAWVDAINRRYLLSPDWMHFLEEQRIRPLPPPPPIRRVPAQHQ